MPLRKPTKKSSNTASRISKARLAAMIEEATVDAYGDSEQTTGWYTMLEEHLALPFETTMLGVLVKVVALDVRGDNDIVAICTRGRERQSVPVLAQARRQTGGTRSKPRSIGRSQSSVYFLALPRDLSTGYLSAFRRILLLAA